MYGARKKINPKIITHETARNKNLDHQILTKIRDILPSDQ
jgi:hypothetical protein